MADARRLMAFGLSPDLAKELATKDGSGLQIGTTGETAMAGNRQPAKTIRGGVLKQDAIADLGEHASDVEIVATVNAMLSALRAAGVIDS